MPQTQGTVHTAGPSAPQDLSQQIAQILAPVIVLGLIVLALRVLYLRIKYLWKFGEMPRIYIRGRFGKRRPGD